MSSNVSVNSSLQSKEHGSKRSSLYFQHLNYYDIAKERPYQSMDFLDIVQEPSSVVLPLDSQESAIIEDLLTCFVGRNGDFIVSNPVNEVHSVRTFRISSSINDKLSEGAQRCLLLGSYYSTNIRFVEQNESPESGRVNQTLAECIRSIIQCYYTKINELEDDVASKHYTIQMLYHSIQPILTTMAFVNRNICGKILRKRLRGGKTLSVLHKAYSSTYNGSAEHDIALKLLSEASKPYLESVKKWIFRGIIFDPFNEFMICENPKVDLKTDVQTNYWVKKYQIRPNCVPKFLEKVTNQILNSGKYLMVASNCAGEQKLDFLPENELVYSPDEKYIEIIDDAYKFSSKYLYDIILNDYKIVERMKSVKRYFLMYQGDFITTIFDICGEELTKSITDIIPSRFTALVDLAVRVQSTDDDPYREAISLMLKPVSIVKQLVKLLNINTPQENANVISVNAPLTGIDAFALQLKTEWPISLIFNEKNINYYQMFFRHIIYIKYLEMLLCRVWLYDMSLEKKYCNDIHLVSYALRHKMIHFVQNMAYYMLEEVIEPNWNDMINKIPELQSVDALLQQQKIFIDNCLQDCLLKDIQLFYSFRDILTTCKEFTEYIALYEKKSNEISSVSFTNKIIEFEKDFGEKLEVFIEKISNEVARESNKAKFLSILHRFDAIESPDNVD